MALSTTRARVALTVGILVLAAAVFGGLWVVKERGEQARRDTAIQIAQETLSEQSAPGVIGSEKPKDTEGEQATGEGGQQASDKAPGQEGAPVATNDDNVSVGELPQTGPAEQLLALVVVAVVTFAGTSFIASKKHLRSL